MMFIPHFRKMQMVGAVGLMAGLFVSAPVLGATATTTMAVTATVQATCTIAVTPMAFGVYTGLVAATTATATLTCTNTTPYTVALSAGLGTGATVNTREMTGGAALLNYALFRDAAHTLNWGTTAGTDTVAGTGNGAAQPVTIYGQVAAGQFVAPGAYTDTVTATVTY